MPINLGDPKAALYRAVPPRRQRGDQRSRTQPDHLQEQYNNGPRMNGFANILRLQDVKIRPR